MAPNQTTATATSTEYKPATAVPWEQPKQETLDSSTAPIDPTLVAVRKAMMQATLKLNESSPANRVIALAIRPTQNGWCWKRRRLTERKYFTQTVAVDFTDPANAGAMLTWAHQQPWWSDLITGPLAKEGYTYSDLWRDICLDVAEERISAQEARQIIRDVIAQVLTERRKVRDAANLEKLKASRPVFGTHEQGK